MAFWDWFKRDHKTHTAAVSEAEIARARAASVFHKLLVRHSRPVEIFDGMYAEERCASALTVK